MSRLSRIAFSLPNAMLPNRKPPASLLRPQPRPARKVLVSLALLLAGWSVGLVLGIGLRPDVTPREPTRLAAQNGDPRTAPVAIASTPPPAEAEALRRVKAAEEASLVAATQARIEAEARLAALRREVAAITAQRDALRDAVRRDTEPLDQRQPIRREPPREPMVAQRELLPRRETAPPATASATLVAPAAPAALAPGPAPLRFPRPDASGAPGGALGAAPRVIVHHRAGSAMAAEAATVMAGQLREAGFETAGLRGVAALPTQRVVRYFHTDDAPAAARLAGRLGRGWAIQDFRSFEPSPAPGLLEVWLPER